MFEKANHIAATMATSVSRRRFLGRIGRGAMVTAAALGGLLALPADVEAGRRCPSGYHWCVGLRTCGGYCTPRGTKCYHSPRC